MNQELERFNSLIEGTSKVIANPSKSLKETMGVKNVTSALIVSAGAISSTCTPLGISIIGEIGKLFFRKKREQEEKDRMYQEVIRKQQAAINKQREINRQLEEELRKAERTNEANQEKIEDLEQQIENLEEVIDLLNQQAEQFEEAA